MDAEKTELLLVAESIIKLAKCINVYNKWGQKEE